MWLVVPRLCGERGGDEEDDRPFTDHDSAVYPVENMYDRIVINYQTQTQGIHREGVTTGKILLHSWGYYR